MQRNLVNILRIGAIAALSTGALGIDALSMEQQRKPAAQSIPTTVLEKYESSPKQHLYRRIDLCKKGDETIYVVLLDTGVVGDQSYFKGNGEYVGRIRLSDIPIPPQKEPFDLTKYKCVELRSKES